MNGRPTDGRLFEGLVCDYRDQLTWSPCIHAIRAHMWLKARVWQTTRTRPDTELPRIKNVARPAERENNNDLGVINCDTPMYQLFCLAGCVCVCVDLVALLPCQNTRR